ncbi:DMT family transporter [Erwinia typographi]|uniref:DMT family transporter n=1 Tax=Erwinia typographi TaxID=371042 RepID=UPI0006919C7C|nr:DMT family transporter [Erwinia typographi]
MIFSSRRGVTGMFWAFIAILVWSSSLIMLRSGVNSGLSAYDLTALRYSVAAILLLPVLFRRGTRANWPGLINTLIMIALFGAPFVMLLSLAVKTAPAAAAGALNPGVMAIASVFISRLIYGQKLTRMMLLGIAIAIAGILGFAWAGGGFAPGYLVLLATGFMWAGYAAFVRSKAIPAIYATTFTTVGSAIVYLPVYILALPTQIMHVALSDIVIQGIFQGVMVTAIAVYAFSRSVELLGPVAGTSLPALIPVVTLILAIPLLQEIPQISEVVSACLETIGIALILIKGGVASSASQKSTTVH